jgi:hypothetical protein
MRRARDLRDHDANEDPLLQGNSKPLAGGRSPAVFWENRALAERECVVMLTLRIALLMTLSVSLLGSLAHAEMPLVGGPRPGQVTVFYNPLDGNLAADSGGPPVTTFLLMSESGVFTGARPPQLRGIFDNYVKDELFHLTPTTSAWKSLDFGPTITPGLGPELADDLTLLGSFLPEGAFEDIGLQIVPEPSGVAALQLGMLMALAWRYRRRV